MKKVDDNGFWRIKDNPISKVGVFPYLGKQISSELEPNKIYMVYRPAEELFSEEALESFNRVPVPLVEDHTMIGKDNTPAEEKGVEGVIQNVRRSGDKLIGDIAIYSDHMKDKINDGKKELSMGYYCQYELADGEYKGEHYDAIQREIRSNHVALVDRGRMGSDVRVYDAFCFDAAISTAEFNNNGVLKMAKSQDAEFKESEHPRDKDGKFTSGGGSSGGTSSSNTKSENPFSKTLKNEGFKKDDGGSYSKTFEDGSIASISRLKLKEGNPAFRAEFLDKDGKYHKKDFYNTDIESVMRRVNKGEGRSEGASSGGEGSTAKSEAHKKAGETRKANSVASHINKVTEYLKETEPHWAHTDYKNFSSLHGDMQKRAKSLLGTIQSHTRNEYSGEIIAKKGAHRYKLNYQIRPDGEGGMGVTNWKITSANDALDISDSKGVDMKNLKRSLDGDLVIEHEDEEEKKVTDKCGRDEEEELFEEEKKSEDEEELFEEEEEKKSEDADEEEILEEEKEVDDDDDEDKEKESEDEEEEEIEKKKDIEKSLDALPSRIIKMIAQRDALVSKLKPIIGNFNYQTKTLDQVAKYACDALDIKVSSKNAKAAIKGYLAGYKKSAKKYSMDSAISSNKTNSQIEKYLKGE